MQFYGMMNVLRTTTIFLSTLVVLLLVNQYFFCPRFMLPDPEPFMGERIYNPYESIHPDQWVKCNFHAHAKAWNGFTNGHGTASDVHKAYGELNYGIHCVSNYHHVDTTHCKDQSYIPAYEHGYNINKTHQLVLGTDEVEWLDFLFSQSIHNKQHVLNHLKKSGALVILNHPELRNGYTPEDFARLTNYDCMEVLNPSVTSTRQWDAALSAGKRVFIIGNDDLHDVISRDRLGAMCTFVNVAEPDKEFVLHALRSGSSYGVAIGEGQHLDSIPYLKGLKVRNDTILIEMSHAAKDIFITGQAGKTIKTLHDQSLIFFTLRKEDHYARATFEYANGTKILLNPLFYDSGIHTSSSLVSENVPETILYRAIGIVILLGWLLLMKAVLSANIYRLAGRRLRHTL